MFSAITKLFHGCKVKTLTKHIQYRHLSIQVKQMDDPNSMYNILPTELAKKYVASLLDRTHITNSEIKTVSNIADPSYVTEQESHIIQQVKDLFNKENVGKSLCSSLHKKYQDIFCQHIAFMLTKQLNQLLIEPRARLIQHFMQDLTLSENDITERLEYIGNWKKPIEHTFHHNMKGNELELSSTEETTQEEETVSNTMDWNNDHLLVAREVFTSPLYHVLRRILNSPDGFMALLFLRGTLSFNKNALTLQGTRGRQLKYYVNQLSENLLQSEYFTLEAGSLESNGRSLMYTLNDWREEWGIRRTMHDLVDRLYRGYRFYNLKHKLNPSYSLGTLHLHFSNSIPVNDESIIRNCVSFERKQDSHAIINHIRVRSFIGGLGMEQQFINQIIQTELKQGLHYNGDIYTLSPIPFFVSWLFHQLKLYSKVVKGDEYDVLVLTAQDASVVEEILTWLKNCTQESHHVKQVAQLEQKLSSAKDTLIKLMSYFLLNARGTGMRCLDSVGRLHFSNGAELYRINFMADMSKRRLRQSLGFTANYRYRLQDQEKNMLRFFDEQVIAVAEEAHPLQQLANMVAMQHAASHIW
eukprot:jgi/Galph1/2808/GphlegSOOS_G1466.1